MRDDARLAILEAELLYLCADLGGDVLAKVIDIVESLRADGDVDALREAAEAALALRSAEQRWMLKPN
jgi:hypothetical protein